MYPSVFNIDLRRAGKNLFAVDPGFEHLDLPKLARGNGEHISVEQHEISFLARLESSQNVFLMSGPGGINGKAGECLFQRHVLFGIPAAGRVVLLVLPGCRGVQPIKRIRMLHRKIRSIGG